MDDLPHSVLLHIMSRLDDSADVARCRVTSKAFDTVFPGLRSVNLRCSVKWYNTSGAQHMKPFKTVFLDLISKLETVESVCIRHDVASSHGVNHPDNNEFYLIDQDFVKEWLPMVSGSLNSLSISGLPCHSQRKSNVLALISKYCPNLVNLKLQWAWLSVDNLNPMPMLTSLTLALTNLEDEHLNELNRCFPNLQVLNLQGVRGLKDPKIHLLNLQICNWAVYKNRQSLTLITPNLITPRIDCLLHAAIHVEAPMLSQFHLALGSLNHAGAFTVKKFENLKTLWLECRYISSLLSEFPITETVENLTLHLRNKAPRAVRDSEFSLRKVFTLFPNVSSLCMNSAVWLDLEGCTNAEGWEILDGRKGLKTICAYLELVDPSLTFSSVACVLDQCVGLSEVSWLIHVGVDDTVSKSFMSKCMAHWTGLKWRWGIWSDEMEDSWITNNKSN